VRISAVFGYPPEYLSRLAGQLPPAINIDEEMEQILHEIAKLNKADQREVLAYIRMKRNLREKNK